SWMWVQASGPPDRQVVLFDYTTSRAQEVPLRLLEGYRGYVMTVRDPSSPHSNRPPDSRCCAPDFFLEPARHDAPRQQSRKSLPL
ncbi:IS66 family transposase, partial [Pseudomonas hunanensis]|uniref:IS66 family transposase n=1 Tax=Pseudomonas hunanensis TaxID=1247546 RepID=UPI0030D88562